MRAPPRLAFHPRPLLTLSHHTDYQVNPFPASETEARVIAHAWQHRAVPPLPPLLRLTADQTDRNIGNPQEFDNADNMLRAIGEGDSGEGWDLTSAEKRKGRTEAMALRREHLGY